MGNFVDLIGCRFNRLTVIRQGRHKGNKVAWECMCDCGGTALVPTNDLKSGHTSSCGCLHKEQLIKRNLTHALAGHRLYEIWSGIKKRCRNPNSRNYMDYGGRGIAVCEEWEEFEPFYNWSVTNGYADNLTIDRRDNDGDYAPDNCRWVTCKQQQNNKRNNHIINIDGKTKTLAEWEKISGIAAATIRSRVKYGWNGKDLIRPVGAGRWHKQRFAMQINQPDMQA